MSYAIYLRKSRADAEAEARGECETLARHERDGRKQYRRVRNSGATRVRCLHDPIISEDLFLRANDASTGRSGRMPVRSEYALSNPLAGLVKCGLCGK